MAIVKDLCALRFPSDPMEGFADRSEFLQFQQQNCNQNHDINATQAKVLMLRLYEALLGRQPEPAALRQYHFAVTILYLFLTINLCRLLRLVNSHVIPTMLRPLCGDVISTFQTISCGFENGFVRKVYGMGAYCVQTFCLGLWSSWTINKNTSGNPVTTFKHFFVRRHGFARTLLHMTSQMLAGLVAYRYARQFWSLELSEEHGKQLRKDGNCVTDLSVPVFLGFFIELSATIVDTVVSRTTTKRFMFEHYEQFAKGIFSIWMTIMGLNLTGMYLNPANATARNFGCSGVTRLEFVLVYWLGPIVGAAVGIVVHQNFHTALRALSAQFSTITTQQQQQQSDSSSVNSKSCDENTSRDHATTNDDSGFVESCQSCLSFTDSSSHQGCHLATITEEDKKNQ